MKLTPSHKPVDGPKGESYKARVKKARMKKALAIKTKKRKRKLNK